MADLSSFAPCGPLAQDLRSNASCLTPLPAEAALPVGLGLRAALFLLAALAFAYWGWSQWDLNRYIFDDAFISYRYAYNLVHGHGLVYNVGERVEGYSNFLWVLLAAAAIRVRVSPLLVTSTLGLICYLLEVAICVGMTLFAGRAVLWRRLLVLPLVTVLVLPAGFASGAGSGLETQFVGLLILTMGILNHVRCLGGAGGRVLASLIPLLLVLTRLDAALIVAASAIALFAQTLSQQKGVRQALAATLLRFTPTALGLAVWLAYKWWYYGSLLPNTYYAKGAHIWQPEVGLAYVRSFLMSFPHVLVLLPFVLLGMWAPRALRHFALFGCLATALHLLYVIRVNADFMQYRFMWEIYALYVAISIGSFVHFADRFMPVVLLSLGCTVLLSMLQTVHEDQFGMQKMEDMDRYAHDGMRVGPALGRALPSDTIIATTLAGTLAYFSRLTVVDQWGLTDAFVGHQPADRFGTRGHLKFAPMSYLRKRGANLYIEHPVICNCSAPCREDKPNVFVRIDERDCMRSWYIGPTPELTAYLCEHPELFVLNNVKCPAKPSAPAPIGRANAG